MHILSGHVKFDDFCQLGLQFNSYIYIFLFNIKAHMIEIIVIKINCNLG